MTDHIRWQPKQHSLRIRLVVAFTVVLIVGGLAVAIAAFAYGRQAAQQSFDRLLFGAASQIAASLSLNDGEVRVDIPVSSFELLSLAPSDRVVYGVFSNTGELITGYETIDKPPADQMFYNGRFAGEQARFVRIQRQFSERAFVGAVDVIIGQTTEARRELAGQITRNALIGVGSFGFVMFGLAALAVQSALLPLRRIEREFAERSSKDLTPVSMQVPSEISGLVASLNRFINRIDRQIWAMQTLIADASHQLRTPIAALRAQAELAAEETDPDRQLRIVSRIHERSKNLSRLTDQLLNHALIIHRSDAGELSSVDLRIVANDVLEQLDHQVIDPAVTIRLNLPEAEVLCYGDHLSLVEACKNLVNNAVTYGAPPITLFVQEAQGRAIIGLADCGPGFPQDMWDDAGTRFFKNAGVSSKSAGLGLAIVAEVARAHGGDMVIGRAASGEFQVSIALPVGVGA